MNRLIALFSILLGSLYFSGAALAQQVRVMQWNVERGLGRLSNNTNGQAKAIARIVNYNQPDVLLFNEIDASNQTITASGAALIDWATNNIPYLGSKTGVTFWVSISSLTDGFIRNGAISRYPIISGSEITYNDGLRGMHAFKIQLSGTNILQLYHAHLKAGTNGVGSANSCTNKQEEAQFDANTIFTNSLSSPLPYVFSCDCNEDEAITRAECVTNATYHPITTLKQSGAMVDYIPTNLTGSRLTWSTTALSKRFDYIFAATNRITASAIVTQYVFSASDWAAHGKYTNELADGLSTDSATASDHYNVFTTFSFPTTGTTNFNVTPTATFASSGNAGGPFSPSTQIYTLTNTDTIPLFWTVTKTSAWLSVSPLATNLTLGAGASTSITVSVNSAANSLCAGAYADTINFSNTATGVSVARGVTLTVAPTLASFTASPTNGVEPLGVTFFDTSTGPITTRFWNFGDGDTTNVITNSVIHTYAAGSYNVTLTVSGPCGASTNTQSGYINVLTAFQNWQMQYFGSTNNPSAASGADPDGDGQNNLAEFLSGTNPTNSASAFRIVSVVSQGSSNLITWTTAGGTTNVVQASLGDVSNNNSSYSNNFFDVSGLVIMPSTGDAMTNWLDDGSWLGGFTNWPARYYRIRLGP